MRLHQIVQTRDAFVFLSEFVSAARIIRLNARRMPAAITTWLGDSIGRWEGDTLVVETRGFTASDHARLAPSGRTGESNFVRRDEPVLEYACHEANYSLIHILEGARVRDGVSAQ